MILLQRGIHHSLNRYFAVIFVQAKLEICYLGIYTDVAELKWQEMIIGIEDDAREVTKALALVTLSNSWAKYFCYA